MIATAVQVAQYLIRRGYKIGKITEPDEVQDGSIEILKTTPECHVQVGQGYYGLVLHTGKTFTFCGHHTTYFNVVNDLERMVKRNAS